MFGDFTNQPPPPNDPPQWTDDAPADSSHISVPSAANTEFMSVVDQGLWLTDEAGFSAIDLQCSSSTWPISEDANGSWWVTTQESGQGTVSCTPFDEDDNGTSQGGGNRQVYGLSKKTQKRLVKEIVASIGKFERKRNKSKKRNLMRKSRNN